MKSSIHPPSRKSSGDWEDSDRGAGNKAARRAGKEVEAKSPTYIAYIKNKKKKAKTEQLDPKKVEAGSAPADQKADSQIANKEKKVAIMKRQILQKKMQAVRSGATADITASYNPVDEGIDPRGGGDKPDLSPKQQDTERKQTALEREKIAKKRRILQQMRQQAVSQGRQPTGHTAREEVVKENPVVDVVKKGVERHKKATKKKKKGVNYELMAQEFDPKGAEVTELNRYEKETGKSSGSLNMPKGRPTKKGGDPSPVMRSVRTSMRKETGKPEGQQKKTKGVKSTAGTGKYLAKQKEKKDYAARAKKAGYKNPQDYANVVARYGGEANYKAGRGLD